MSDIFLSTTYHFKPHLNLSARADEVNMQSDYIDLFYDVTGYVGVISFTF